MHRRWTMGPVAAVAVVLGVLSPPTDTAYAQSKNAQRAAPAASSASVPYKAVAITLPERVADPSLAAFRKTLAGIAERKDRAALAKLVHKGFFWQRESGDGADAKKSGIANLSAAIGLDDKDDPEAGWETILILASDPTGFTLPERKGVVCSPADPGFDEDALQQLTETTKSDIGDWVYPLKAGVDVRAAARADAPVTGKLGLAFVRMSATDGPEESAQGGGEFVNVALPSGKSGFVMAEDIAALSASQICYIKDGGNWQIAGIVGGAE